MNKPLAEDALTTVVGEVGVDCCCLGDITISWLVLGSAGNCGGGVVTFSRLVVPVLRTL